MDLGERLIYDISTGQILNGTFEERIDTTLTEEMAKKIRPKGMDFIDLPFGYNDNNFRDALEYHIDISKDKKTTDLKDLIVITKHREHIETEEEKLRKEKEQVENLLLMKADENLGGIL